MQLASTIGRAIGCLMAMLLAMGSGRLHAEATNAGSRYRAGPGDVVEVSVRGLAELQRRAPIAVDGTLSLPGVGTVAVGGLTLSEMRARLQAAVAGRAYALRPLESDSGAGPIEIDDIYVAVAEFRPIYVKGDVARSGEYAYRGTLSVREALALAGGFPALAIERRDLPMLAYDLDAEERASWHDLVRARADAWRIKSELGLGNAPATTLVDAVPADAPVARQDVVAITDMATSQLELQKANTAREHQSLDEIISQLREEIKVTENQIAAEERAHEADLAELRNLTTLKQQGVVNPQRFADTRRAVLFSSTRILQANVRLTEAKRILSERQLQKFKLSADRTAELHRQLEVAASRIAETEAKLESVAGKQQLIGRLGGADSRDRKRVATYVIFRRGAEGIARLDATEDTEVLPGDVVEVTLGATRASVAGQLRKLEP